MREVPDIAVQFLLKHEASKTQAYQDSKGVWTIGVGHTGPEVHEGLVWTQDQIAAALKSDLSKAVKELYDALKPDVIDKLTDNQWAALISFVFNDGEKRAWHIWTFINEGNLEAVPGQLRLFVNSDGKRIQGLVNRREAEIDLWMTKAT